VSAHSLGLTSGTLRPKRLKEGEARRHSQREEKLGLIAHFILVNGPLLLYMMLDYICTFKAIMPVDVNKKGGEIKELGDRQQG